MEIPAVSSRSSASESGGSSCVSCCCCAGCASLGASFLLPQLLLPLHVWPLELLEAPWPSEAPEAGEATGRGTFATDELETDKRIVEGCSRCHAWWQRLK